MIMDQVFKQIRALFSQSTKSLTTVVEPSEAKPKATRAPKKTTVYNSQVFPSTPQDVHDRETASYRDAADNQSNPLEAADNPAMGVVNAQASPDDPGFTAEKNMRKEARYRTF